MKAIVKITILLVIGFLFITPVATSTQTESLRMTQSYLRDLGRFFTVEELRNLKLLNLTDSKVTDGGLTRLRPLGKLQYLYMINTRVTGKGVANLKRVLPDCSIWY